MKIIKTTLIISVISIFLSGCAASYKAINPKTVNYSSHDIKDGISYSYKYDVLNEKGNKKYAKREQTKGIKVVAIKITNNTDSTIYVGRDILFYSGYNQIMIMEPESIKNELKQIAPAYLLYLLLTPLNLYTITDDGMNKEVHTYRIGLFLGPSISLGNMLVASTANDDFLKELRINNIMNVQISKGETFSGLMGFRDVGYNAITLRLRK